MRSISCEMLKKNMELEVKDVIQEQVEIIQNNKSLFRLFASLNEISPETIEHSVRVSAFSYLIGERMNLNTSKLETLVFASLVHDIGKLKIPIELLTSTKKYTEEEFKIVQNHTVLGAKILCGVPKIIKKAVLEHHENFNGSGYPNQKSYKKLSIFGKILRVADVVDAMYSERSYKKAIDTEKVCSYLAQNRGILFDPKIANIAIEILQSKTN